jgi:hypothetical protein
MIKTPVRSNVKSWPQVQPVIASSVSKLRHESLSLRPTSQQYVPANAPAQDTGPNPPEDRYVHDIMTALLAVSVLVANVSLAATAAKRHLITPIKRKPGSLMYPPIRRGRG